MAYMSEGEPIFDDAIFAFYQSQFEDYDISIAVEYERVHDNDLYLGDAFVVGNDIYGWINCWVENPIIKKMQSL